MIENGASCISSKEGMMDSPLTTGNAPTPLLSPMQRVDNGGDELKGCVLSQSVKPEILTGSQNHLLSLCQSKSSTDAENSLACHNQSPESMVVKPSSSISIHVPHPWWRSFVLAYGIRAGLSLLFRLSKILSISKSRHKAWNLIFRSLGRDAIQFAMFVGGFTTIYKASTMILYRIRGIHDRWSELIAGGLAGFAILFEEHDHRVSIAQYIFLRAVQCVIHDLQARRLLPLAVSGNFSGSALIFLLTAAPISYTCFIYPELVPPGYLDVMRKIPGVPLEMYRLIVKTFRNRSNLRSVVMDPDLLRKYIIKHHGNMETLLPYQSGTLSSLPCCVGHIHHKYCADGLVWIMMNSFRSIFPAYVAVSCLPVVVQKRRLMMRSPKEHLLRILVDSIRSSSFLAIMFGGFASAICFKHWLVFRGILNKDHDAFYFLAGLVGGLSIFIEKAQRRPELALYGASQVLHIISRLLIDRFQLPIPAGTDAAVFAASMGCIMMYYKLQPQLMWSTIRVPVQRFLNNPCWRLQVRHAGHNKWSKIHRLKAVNDQQRSERLSKLGREIIAAVRAKGADPALNTQLAAVLSRAKSLSMPKSNIDNAINKGLGNEKSDSVDEVIYEAFAPGGIALLIHTLTDNRNRTFPQLRSLLTKHGGSSVTSGSIAWMFDKKGVIRFSVPEAKAEFDNIFEHVINFGAEDVNDLEDNGFELICGVADLMSIKKQLEEKGCTVQAFDISFLPNTRMAASPETLARLKPILAGLQSHVDVLEVYSNAEWPTDQEDDESV